jgi:hypothetical protein
MRQRMCAALSSRWLRNAQSHESRTGNPSTFIGSTVSAVLLIAKAGRGSTLRRSETREGKPQADWRALHRAGSRCVHSKNEGASGEEARIDRTLCAHSRRSITDGAFLPGGADSGCRRTPELSPTVKEDERKQ